MTWCFCVVTSACVRWCALDADGLNTNVYAGRTIGLLAAWGKTHHPDETSIYIYIHTYIHIYIRTYTKGRKSCESMSLSLSVCVKLCDMKTVCLSRLQRLGSSALYAFGLMSIHTRVCVWMLARSQSVVVHIAHIFMHAVDIHTNSTKCGVHAIFYMRMMQSCTYVTHRVSSSHIHVPLDKFIHKHTNISQNYLHTLAIHFVICVRTRNHRYSRPSAWRYLAIRAHVPAPRDRGSFTAWRADSDTILVWWW